MAVTLPPQSPSPLRPVMSIASSVPSCRHVASTVVTAIDAVQVWLGLQAFGTQIESPASIAVTTVEATWRQLGTLEAIDITGRNGLGDWGGRVTAMTLVGSDQSVSLTGDAFAGALGLNSDWFTVTNSLGGPAVGTAATPDGKGYWVVGSNGSVAIFGDATYDGSADGLPLSRPVVGMAATPDGKGYWLVASDGGIFS